MLSWRSHLLFLVRYVNVVDMCQHNLHCVFYKVVELLMLYSLTLAVISIDNNAIIFYKNFYTYAMLASMVGDMICTFFDIVNVTYINYFYSFIFGLLISPYYCTRQNFSFAYICMRI